METIFGISMSLMGYMMGLSVSGRKVEYMEKEVERLETEIDILKKKLTYQYINNARRKRKDKK